VVVGTSIKTWLPPLPSMLIFATSGNALYFGPSPFPGNLSGMLSDWKGLCSTKVTLATYCPPSFSLCGLQFLKYLRERLISPAIATSSPIPNQQTLVSCSRRGPPAHKLGLSHRSPQIYDEGLTKDLKPMDTATFVGILALES